jgi:NADPH:quinone reductase-like Zn-dependent oxidoreductase
LGTELSGVVADIGATVTRFKLGDEVIAYPGGSLGAHAEYFVMNENGVMAHKSPKISFEDAASLSFGGLTALFFLRDGAKIQPGEEVLVIGASGNVGSAAVQIAKHLGARVTAVCSGQNAELARSIGADEVIDYTNVDWRTRPHASFDVIFDTIGGARWQHVLPLLRPGGRLCLAVIDSKDIGSLIFARKKGLRLLTGDSKGSIKDLEYLNQLAERGEFRPVIQSVFSLNQIVEAHRVVDSGRKKGSVVVKLE